MENEKPLWIVQGVNALLDPVVRPLFRALHLPVPATGELIPPHLVMGLLILLFWTVVGLMLRTRLSVENPSRFQIVMEDLVSALLGLLNDWIGPEGRRFLALVGALGAFILVGNLMGLVPGLMSPTSSMSVTAGCAITIWVYYHFQGIRAQGIVAYVKHFAAPPGAPIWLAPIMLPIELISHVSRILSLTLRLFGNIFGEETIIFVLLTLLPWYFPAPVLMMGLGLVTATLQAFIFVLLSIIYLQGAVALEHEHEEHEHDHGDAMAHHPQAAVA